MSRDRLLNIFFWVFFFSLVCFFTDVRAQSRKFNYDSIDAVLWNSEIDSVLAKKYAYQYLRHARTDSDLNHMAWAYYYLSRLNLNNTKIGLLYADSIIELSKKIKNSKDFPLLGFSVKSQHLCAIGEYKDALDLQLQCYEIGKKSGREYFTLSMKSNIASTRRNMGEKVDFLPIYKENLSYLKRQSDRDTVSLIITLYNIAYEFLLQNKPDSAINYSSVGLKLSIKNNLKDKFGHGKVLKGMYLYHKGDYKSAIDSIKTGMQYSSLNYKLGLAYLYLGKSEIALKNKNRAVEYFRKVDSLNFNVGLINYQQIEVYPVLINYYAQQKDYKNQLAFTNKLLKLDRKLDSTRSYVISKAREQYDLPLLINSQKELIAKLKTESKQKQRLYLLGISAFVLIVLVALILWGRKRKLMQNTLEKTGSSEKKEIYIQDELRQRIIEELDKFEKKHRYLNRKCTLGTLAKELNTNSVYLSKIVNESKKMNFANYLNNLRIDYIVKRLQTDNVLKTYSVEGIASECGFNTAQSFSKAFQKKTGQTPSNYIKALS